MIAAGKGDAQPVFGKDGFAAMFTSVDDLGYGIGVARARAGRQRIAGRGRRARRARSTLPLPASAPWRTTLVSRPRKDHAARS
jgi:hypothetical protein